ncbi:MAG: zf-HC2 domain-containing protein [Halomonas sp.]|uniref:zf-HC2 domain-containing protein n=1 Tax=Halomonas sp. TaxID=1486246 RepID=UPI0019FE2391|nr:zf-HC2 domain-containing protein [Halomonas sp.]MBE0488089.1 zf-HC2 domain-containing protein [Halomonas sp.]
MMMCKEATRLMSLKQDRRLTFQESMSLRFHLTMCDACRQCDRQFSLLHRAGKRFEDELEKMPGDDGAGTGGPGRRE